MNVKYMELLSRKRRPDGVIEGMVLMHGTKGERIQIHCAVRPDALMLSKRVNGALAEDAMRQLRRMPEYRRKPMILVSRFGMPQAPIHRVIHLVDKGKPIAGCQAE